MLPGRIYELQYETLLEDFEPEVRRLLEHCSLSWNKECLEFHNNSRSVATASSAQVRAPLYKTSVEGWRKYEPYLGPLLEALGPYAPI